MWRLILSMLATLVTGQKVSLYCFTCATPDTYEVGMIAGMAKLGLGMFECDGYDIISNVSADVLFKDYPEVAAKLKDHVHVIDMNLYVKKVKGPVGHDISSPATDPNSPLYQGKDATMEHLANTPVFKEVWSKIFKLGNFGKYDYTAKLDIDAVIVPARLSGMLGGRPDTAEYFQNAYHDMYGNFLHGPIELISKKGVYAFRDARHICFDKIDQMAFGEDFFAKQCWDMIQIHPVPTMEIRLLYDDYEWGLSAKHRCDALNPDPMVFKTQQYFGVYHPRKSMTTWLQCREQTGVPGIPSKAEMKAAIKLAGPGKPYDMKPLKKYEEIALVLQHHSVPVIFCAAGLLTMAFAVLVSKHRIRSNRAIMATAGLEAGHSMEDGLVAEIE
ncbi:unnamed protein product [Cladocopium goreaui]|uniref:Fe2OG dioxygenase domain-containing protein n=1 Tax=Cladocopium goreaui TaxID=2562237 RepID=A0A9P1DEY1_9DINO|nr:unnamed protein product [Cladocopium goreaui]